MKPLIDVLDEMNQKEDKVRDMVINKLIKLRELIGVTLPKSDDLMFVDTIIEDLQHDQSHRITKIEIKYCNKLYRKYNK
tara:strand:+ start:345 stop:581 length:237 start_codon:yes stop_codon:yes gene_type:complete